ncbi:MAG: GLUG motif-containing protein [Chlamydiota bacterium]
MIGKENIRWSMRIVICLLALPLTIHALPQEGKVVSGESSITQLDIATMEIRQHSDKSIVEWKDYSIGAKETVSYLQPNRQAISLNRVVGGNPSEIYGKIKANGQVWLINPNGILVGSKAKVAVGSFLGSTLSIADEDFLKDRYLFDNHHQRGKVSNSGFIKIDKGGYLVLLSPTIVNEGVMMDLKGQTYLASGEKVTLQFAGHELIGYNIDQAVAAELIDNESAITNKGDIFVEGGLAVLSGRAAGQIGKMVVNNEGLVEASTIHNQQGRIYLLGGMAAPNKPIEEDNTVRHACTLDVSAPPKGGDGGFAETSAAQVIIEKEAYVDAYARNGKKGEWLIDPSDFNIVEGDVTRTSNVIGANTLEGSLQLSDVTIITSSSGVQQGDINIEAGFSWDQNQLSLKAHNDINLNATISATGTAQLVLNYDGQLKIGLDDDGYFKGKANLAPNTSLTINGQQYNIISSLGAEGSTSRTDLQGIQGHPSESYVLGTDIDGSPTSQWDFTPLGTPINTFSGNFEGLGHTISDIYIKSDADYVGLFGVVNGGNVSNTALSGGSVESDGIIYGGLGGLMGVIARGKVWNCYSSAQVISPTVDVVGGLIGNVESGAEVSNSHSSGTIEGKNYVGGLIGHSTGNTIDSSYATGAVTGHEQDIGGLIGYSKDDTITNSYARGDVAGVDNIGGFVGYSDNSTIANSYSQGDVSSSSDNIDQPAGGLVGFLFKGAVSKCFARGAVYGFDSVGGLAGATQNANIDKSYATGAVEGHSRVGGLVGYQNLGDINNTYASGAVTGLTPYDRDNQGVGGLVGYSLGTVTKSYAYGNVEGYEEATDSIGGLLGFGNDVSNSYYDSQTSGQNDTGKGEPKTTANMQKIQTYTTDWDIAEGDSDTIWRIYQGETYPLLNDLPYPLRVKAREDSKNPNGHPYYGGAGVDFSGFLPGDDSASLSGQLEYSGSSQGAIMPGTYVLTPEGWSSTHYNIKYVSSVLTITQNIDPRVLCAGYITPRIMSRRYRYIFYPLPK